MTPRLFRGVAHLLLAALLVQAAAGAHAAPLEIMVEDASIPYSQADGTGYANDVVRAAFAAAGVDVALRVVPYARCKAAVMAGRVAGCFNMSWEPALQHRVAFAARPLFQVGVRYYRKRGTLETVGSERGIPAGMRVGIVNGYEYPEATLRLRDRGVRLESGRSEAANLDKLMAGRLDLVVLMVDDIRRESPLLAAPGLQGIVPAFRGSGFGSYLGFSLLHPEGESARTQFNHGYDVITGNGTLRAIRQKWGYSPDRPLP